MQNYTDSVEEYIKRTIFSKTGETFLDLSSQEDILYSELNDIGQWLCKDYIKGDSSFYLLDSVQVQAAAVHGHQAVLVYKGMLDLAGNITGLVTGANVKEGK